MNLVIFRVSSASFDSHSLLPGDYDHVRSRADPAAGCSPCRVAARMTCCSCYSILCPILWISKRDEKGAIAMINNSSLNVF